MSNYCTAITALFGEYRKIPRITAATDRGEQRRIHALNAGIHRQQHELQQQAAKEFATLNGWRHTEQIFSPKTLARGGTHAAQGECPCEPDPYGLFDHVVYFREISRPYRPAAIVGHPYAVAVSVEKGTRLASALKLELHAPHNSLASWWHPGHTRFFCMIRPGAAVRFLPDQLTFELRFPDDSTALQHA